MENNFNRFDEIQDSKLRSYNRAMLFTNIHKDFGKEAALDYAGLFTESERMAIVMTMGTIKALGADAVKKTILEGMEFDYEPE